MKAGNTVSTIHLLDPATVNQIAAGEVVERPASVVKELVENAIDAGARSIRIDVTSSAKEILSIRIIDDGSGMSSDDALLAFTPHATSKITRIEDLHHINTLGFRGEALASIAAVSKVSLTTRPRNTGEAIGTKVLVEGGKIQETSEIGAPEGTNVLVEDLFFNTPARKKFQRSKNTEIAHIHAILEGICLAHPGISFRLYINQNEQLVTDRSPRILDTIARIFGSDVVKDLIPLSLSLPFMKISGYTSRPSRARRDASRIMIAINQRYVSSTIILGAVKEGYGTLLSKDRFPIAFLTFEIDTELVDVNVHPTKKLVRLSREKEITRAIREAVKTALLSHDLIPDVVAPSQLFLEESSKQTTTVPDLRYDFTVPAPPGISEALHSGTVMTDRQLRQTELLTGMVPVDAKLPVMEVIGQFGGIYILATTETGELVLIDQHAVHERILYEQVIARTAGDHRSQELIVPFILHRTLQEGAILRDLMPALAQEGFVLEEFGRDTFLVRAIPVVLGKLDDTSIIDEMVSDLISEEPVRSVNTRERITRIIACRGAIKAGTVCTREQCQRLIHQIRYTKNPFTCPHGRPTMIRFSRTDLDTMFKRI
ncbi:MAG: DNA mismatch repair endonuclease MutL [Methanoregula sp.]|jgi:DNA mismatch repair protein MutL|nr:DNA mismatch repair endonuclease MutL [Methanoregula sp.]